MFAADFKNTYRGALLGVFWNFALPLVPISVYILLVNLRVFPQFEGLAPSVFISFNVTVWMLLVGTISRPIQVVRQKTQETMKTSLPLSAAICAAFAQLFFDTIVRLVLVVCLIVIFGPVPMVHAPYFIMSLVAGITFCLSLGLVLSIFNMIYPDVDRLTNIFLQYAIFLSGVIFPMSTMGPLAEFQNFNPFNVFISAARDFLFFGESLYLTPLLIWSGIAALVFLMAIRFFYVMEHEIREAI